MRKNAVFSTFSFNLQTFFWQNLIRISCQGSEMLRHNQNEIKPSFNEIKLFYYCLGGEGETAANSQIRSHKVTFPRIILNSDILKIRKDGGQIDDVTTQQGHNLILQSKLITAYPFKMFMRSEHSSCPCCGQVALPRVKDFKQNISEVLKITLKLVTNFVSIFKEY